jgi:uncharacterized protein YukE
MKKLLTLCFLSLSLTLAASGQSNPASAAQPAPTYSYDPWQNISLELSAISKSVQSLNQSMKAFVDKFEKVGGMNFTEKQQKLVLAMEFLARAEDRLATLQRHQIELVEKQGTTRARLAQVERDLYPQSIERSVALEGSTKTEEIRESRRATLQGERSSLQALLSQINANLADTAEAVREAQLQVQRLRKMYLPQIEKELFEP